jgi:hypothetical protein
MTKHTPGPWVVYDDSNDDKTSRIEIVATGKTVARIYHSVPKEDLPNARLIAAAPDLLDALGTALDGWQREFEYLAKRTPVWVEKARAAITKATWEKNNG